MHPQLLHERGSPVAPTSIEGVLLILNAQIFPSGWSKLVTPLSAHSIIHSSSNV